MIEAEPKELTAKDIKRIRAVLGWSQAKLAENLGVGQSAVGMWETGKASPDSGRTVALQQLRARVDEIAAEDRENLGKLLTAAVATGGFFWLVKTLFDNNNSNEPTK